MGFAMLGYAVLRRTALRGGATDDEATMALPGDDLVPAPHLQTTHAITIDAAPAVVWRWLIQCGFRGAGRAGWYSDSWLDGLAEATLFRLTVPVDRLPRVRAARSAEELLPGFTTASVGDVIPDGPPDSAWFVVREVSPDRAYVLHSDSHIKYLTPLFLEETALAARGEFTWVFVLRPLDGGRTRLLLRTRASFGPAAVRAALHPLLLVGEAVVPAAILRGLRRRAERPLPVAPTAGAPRPTA